jgi:hypothetical protein
VKIKRYRPRQYHLLSDNMPQIDVIIHKDTEQQAVTTESQRAIMIEPGKANYQTQAINTALIDAGRSIIMQGMAHYGDLTGDYITQNRVGEMLNIASDVLMIAKGGVVGAIAVGAKYATQAINSIIQQRQNNIKIDYMRKHIGYIEAGGSRYGDIT